MDSNDEWDAFIAEVDFYGDVLHIGLYRPKTRTPDADRPTTMARAVASNRYHANWEPRINGIRHVSVLIGRDPEPDGSYMGTFFCKGHSLQ